LEAKHHVIPEFRPNISGDDFEAAEVTQMALSEKANEPALASAIDLFGELLERRVNERIGGFCAL